jgi:hypothetical protein
MLFQRYISSKLTGSFWGCGPRKWITLSLGLEVRGSTLIISLSCLGLEGLLPLPPTPLGARRSSEVALEPRPEPGGELS